MGRNHSFDGLRGLAAILVVASHLEKIGTNPAPGGFLAVDFFFVLSGYVIAAAYERRLGDGLSLASFAEIRFVRLYPLALLGTALGLLKTVASSLTHQPLGYAASEVAVAAPLNLLMLPGLPAMAVLFPLNPPVWSLFFEAIANAVFAAVLFKARTRALVSFVSLCAVGFLFCSLTEGDPQVGWSWGTIIGGFFRVGFGFFLGQIIYRLRAYLPANRKSVWSLAVFGILMIALTLPVESQWREAWLICNAMVAMPVLVIAAVVLELPKRLHKPAAFLGDLSYPLYTTHLPILFVLGYAFRKLGVPIVAYLPVTILVTCAAATLAARWYDKPVREWAAGKLRVWLSAPEQVIAAKR